SLCIAAAVPSTTALRWIRNLIDMGLFQRRADPAGGRRIYISLTDAAAQAIAAYLADAQAQAGLLV
ncbi:MAG TPA: winged helix DNA-binding protein, partial [Novosphingobium sp.]|nr:winged helix DNA-binding protein [Novosphingobium sp.]